MVIDVVKSKKLRTRFKWAIVNVLYNYTYIKLLLYVHNKNDNDNDNDNDNVELTPPKWDSNSGT
jgi:hypothetical protein